MDGNKSSAEREVGAESAQGDIGICDRGHVTNGAGAVPLVFSRSNNRVREYSTVLVLVSDPSVDL